MTAFDSDHIFPESQYYDLVIPPKRLLCWGFDGRLLAEAHGNSHYAEVFKALLIGLNELAGSKNKRVRESDFSIWGGEYLDGFWVGVPSTINAKTAGIMRHQFEQVTGYDTQDFGDMASLPFILFFRYNRGLVIEYSCDSLAGREDEDAYDSGVRVRYRLSW
jgi:hypothetical protein